MENHTRHAALQTPLSSVKTGAKVTVSSIEGCPESLLRKFVSMGVVSGSELTVTHRGLFGSPINIRVFDSILSLRKNEAALVNVCAG